MSERWAPGSWRARSGPAYSRRLPRPGGPRPCRGRTCPHAAAGVRRRGAAAEAPAGRSGGRPGFPAAGRRLRRKLQGIIGRQYPRHLPPDPADGGGADLRRRQAGGESGPHGRAVRQTEVGRNRNHRWRHLALLSRRHHQRHGVRSRRANPGPRTAPEGLRPIGGDAQPAPRLRRRRLRRPAQHPSVDARLRPGQSAGRPIPRAFRQDQ